MATKGLKYPVAAKYSESTGSPVYTEGRVLGESMTASVQYTKANVKLYADDKQVEADNSITGGTIATGIFGLTLANRTWLLGHTAADSPSVGFTGSGLDETPYMGYGFYGRTTHGTWRAFWYNKVMFSEPNDDLETKGANTVFKTPTLNGEFMNDINEGWGEIQDFTTEAAAKAWLDDIAGIIPKCIKPVASKASGTYSGTQSVTLTAGADEAIYYTKNGTTPSATNGTLYSTAVSVDATCALRAIAIKSEQNNSDIATYEYIITA